MVCKDEWFEHILFNFRLNLWPAIVGHLKLGVASYWTRPPSKSPLFQAAIMGNESGKLTDATPDGIRAMDEHLQKKFSKGIQHNCKI
jgi:hypothetical protein